MIRGKLIMDRERWKVIWDGKSIVLTVSEFAILERLARWPDRIVEPNELMKLTLHANSLHALRKIVERVRKKLGDYDAIRSHYGSGYSFGDSEP